MSILLSLQAVGAQTAEQMPDLTAVTAPTEAEINVIDLAFKGGWIMVVLLLLSLMACYIFIQRLMVIRRAGKEDETFMNRINRERYHPLGTPDERRTGCHRERG